METEATMNNKKAITLSVLVVTLNTLIGHFFAPNGILFTPIVLAITTYLVCFRTTKIKLVYISMLTYLFVALNDIAIKLFSGGSHDPEGLGWIQLLLFVGLIPTLGILVTAMVQRKDEKWYSKLLALAVFLALIAVHLQLFQNLGLGRYYWYDWNQNQHAIRL